MPDLRTLSFKALPFNDPYIAPVCSGSLELNWWLDVLKREGKRTEVMGWNHHTLPDAEELPEFNGGRVCPEFQREDENEEYLQPRHPFFTRSPNNRVLTEGCR